jgi:hypothetical protein
MRMVWPVFALLLAMAPALAQETVEARLREMLRRTSADLRAAQDGQQALQATLDQEKQTTVTLRKQLEELTAQTANAKASITEEQIAQMKHELSDTRAAEASLRASLIQFQDANQKAVEFARAKDAESKAAAARTSESERRSAICAEANSGLTALANEILTLYRSQSFRSLLLSSYEPLLGLKKVELENLVQDYQDKIIDRKFIPGRAPMAAK